MGIFNWKKFPYTNFHDLNLDYFINKFEEIFSEWETLYNTMLTWKDETDTGLEEWKTNVENDLDDREATLRAELTAWKAQTETDISSWETATLNALNAWKDATTLVFEQIRQTAENSAVIAEQMARGASDNAELAYQYKEDAEAAAESIEESAEQIETNKNDISYLKTQLTAEMNTRESADTSLQNNINSERTRAEAEEARIEELFTEPTQEAVNNWLTNHPEATTTVQDSSLTESKFTNELKLKTINDYVTPQMYGATGNGIADDSEAIISLFANANGRKIYFPKGTYKITQNITITTNYIDITGAGMYETILDFSNDTGLIINGYDFSLSNIQINGGSGVISNKYHTRFESCWFYDTNIGLTLNTAYITHCLNCYFTFNNVGVVIGRESYEVVLENCVIDNNFSAGLIVNGYTVGPIIKNCTIEGNYDRTTGNGCGICLNYGYGSIVIDSCWFETNGTNNYSVDIFEAGAGYSAERFENLYNTVNNIVNLNNPNNTYLYGRITITNSKFNYAKYGIATSGYNTKHVIKNNVFSGQIDEYNISVFIGGRTLTENTYDFNDNIVSNSNNQSITTQMLTGINGTYIYTDLTPTGTTQQQQLSTTKFICYNYGPLFDYDPGKKTIFINNTYNNTPMEYTFKPMGNYNTAFLYFSYDVLTLFSVNAQFNALPIRAIYGTPPSVVLNSEDRTITITVPAYRCATILLTQ